MMKTKILIILIVLSASNIFAQTDSLIFQKSIEVLNKKIVLLENSVQELQNTKDNQVTKQEFENLKSQIETIKFGNTKILQEQKSLKNYQSTLKKNYNKLNISFETYKQNTETEVDSLQQVINSNTKNIKKTADELGVKIEDTHKFADQSITDLNKTVSQNTRYWIIAILVVALFVLLVFVLLKKQLFNQKIDLDSNLQNTRKVLEEKGVKLDNKLIEVLEAQLKLINNANLSKNEETDHSLVLKVADEIVRIEKNTARMDSNTKGLKPLIKGIERIKDNFKANGYEMVQLLGVDYNDGMNIDVINFVDDENIQEGKRIITKIIKPQVNYKGVLIQRAQVEVSQN